MNFWKNDNFFVGVSVGLFLIVVTALLMMILVPWIYSLAGMEANNPKLLLLALIPALIMIRYYLKKLNYSKSGSGMVFIVFVCMLLYFLLIANKIYTFPSLFN